MDIVERLTLEAAQAETMIASEHRQRYELAAAMCSGLRVLDLCCGSGYGSVILATTAREVTGVDNDAATVDTARATVQRTAGNVRFEVSDAVKFLSGDIAEQFDLVTCFEGLEHLGDLDGALTRLREHAGRGLKIIASVPNSKLFGEENPYHLTQFGYEEAAAAVAAFPGVIMLPQYLAEGALICPPGASETEVSVFLGERDEIAYANHFIFCVNLEPEAVARAHRGHIQVSAAPVFNRWSEGLKRTVAALRRENARLARAHLGQGGSAAASALASSPAFLGADAGVPGVDEGEGRPGPDAPAPSAGTVRVLDVTPPRYAAGEDPNSWEHRRRRAAEYLVPWIEATVPLAGLTVLEYGCGNAAVSCAVAERAGRVVGVDIDRHWIEYGEAEVRRRGLANVELEHHPVETILEAVARHKGHVDVFLLYAVLEHLTVSERLAVLRLARDVVSPDGAIVVCETPNRLVYTDHHTAQIPFFHLLPDELALQYRDRSARQDLNAAVNEAGSAGGEAAALEAIVRWGRGVSFHEFELVFGSLSDHVLASGYDPLLLAERPVEPDETLLARYLENWRPDLAPAFSRRWLDLILAPEPVTRRPPQLRPWTMETVESQGVGFTRGENLRLPGPEATLWVTLPHPSASLTLVAVPAGPGPFTLEIKPEGASEPLAGAFTTEAGRSWAVSCSLGPPAARIGVRASATCHIVFVGYDD